MQAGQAAERIAVSEATKKTLTVVIRKIEDPGAVKCMVYQQQQEDLSFSFAMCFCSSLDVIGGRDPKNYMHFWKGRLTFDGPSL